MYTDEDLIVIFFKKLWIVRDLSVINDLTAENIIVHQYIKKSIGRETEVNMAKYWFKAFPNNDCVEIETVVKNNNIFCVKWCGVATQEDSFWDMSNTGATINYKGCCFFKVKKHLIVEHQTESNTRMQLIQTGSVPIEPNYKRNNVSLSTREYQCLFLTAQGKTAKEMARILNISPRTVEIHMRNAKDKLQCKNKAQLIEIAVNNNIMHAIPKELLMH